jgi:hypothetical protein
LGGDDGDASLAHLGVAGAKKGRAVKMRDTEVTKEATAQAAALNCKSCRAGAVILGGSRFMWY